MISCSLSAMARSAPSSRRAWPGVGLAVRPSRIRAARGRLQLLRVLLHRGSLFRAETLEGRGLLLAAMSVTLSPVSWSVGCAEGRSAPGAGDLPRRGVEPVEQVGDGDHQDDRGELLLVEVRGGGVPDLVADRVGAVGQPRRGLGQRQRRRSSSVKYGVSRQATTVASRSSLTPALRAVLAPASTQALQPLIWLTRRWTSSERLPVHPAGVNRLEDLLDRAASRRKGRRRGSASGTASRVLLFGSAPRLSGRDSITAGTDPPDEVGGTPWDSREQP